MSEMQNLARKEEYENKELSKSRYERLLLITEALWEFIKKENNYTDENLIEMVNSIDCKDGKRDGRVLLTPKKCPSCNKTMERLSNVCLYCGSNIDIDLFFR